MRWEGIFLMNSYSYFEKMFLESLLSIEYKCLPVVLDGQINCDDGVKKINGYDLVCNDIESEELTKGRAKYYNELELCEGTSISNGLMEGKSHGYIRRNGEVIAEIEYVNSRKRFWIKEVKWFDKDNKVFSADHYDLSGHLCAKSVFDSNENEISKSWLSNSGTEVLTYINSSKDYLYHYKGKEYSSKTLEEVMGVYLDDMLNEKVVDIFTDTVSLIRYINCDVLKRGIYLILHHKNVERELELLRQINSKVISIIALDRETVEKIENSGYNCVSLGVIPKNNTGKKKNKDILICTQSDNIARIEEIANELTEYTINIAAKTEVSDKIRLLGEKKNVNIFPGVSQDDLDELFVNCNYYLDINNFEQLEHSLYEAFYNNHILFAFSDTIHEKLFIADDNVIPSDEWETLINRIRMSENDELHKEMLKQQNDKIFIRDKEAFKTIWNDIRNM